jgi:hypothetical protein
MAKTTRTTVEHTDTNSKNERVLSLLNLLKSRNGFLFIAQPTSSFGEWLC